MLIERICNEPDGNRTSPTKTPNERIVERGGHFQTTHWSLVGRVQADNAELSAEALNELLIRYMPALVTYLCMRRGLSDHLAEDIVQGFVADRILERRLLSTADREKGKFRSLLIRTLDNYAIDQFRKREVAARPSSDNIADVPEIGPSMDAFDCHWAEGTISAAIEWMRTECETEQRGTEWEVFTSRILHPMLDGTKPIEYEQLVQRFHLESPAQASNLLMTAKRRFQRLLRRAVMQYADDDADVEDELRELWRVTAGRPLRLDSDTTTRNDKLHFSHTSVCQTLIDEEVPLWSDHEYASLFADLSDQPLNAIIRDDGVNFGAPPVPTLGDLFVSDRASIDLLVCTKNAGSFAAAGKSQTIPKELGSVVYFLSIAGGLVNHGKRISKSDDSTLDRGFKLTAERSWLPDRLRRLLREASVKLQHTAGPRHG